MRILIGIVAGLIVASPAVAQWKDWDYDLDQEKKPWAELQALIPKYPVDANLLKFDIGSNTANRYFIDGTSVSVGDDGVVRYTLVVKAGGGATNVSFEGIRCEAQQMRTYALGRADGTWSRATQSAWRAVVPREVNGIHFALIKEHFCYGGRLTHSAKQIISNLKYGPKN